MKLDVDTMETFYEMANMGAGLAADRLTSMTNCQTRVRDTRLLFASQDEIAERDTNPEGIAVSVALDGEVGGCSLICFDNESANHIARMVLSEIPESEREEMSEAGFEREGLARSAIREVGTILNNGFLDGWADVLDTGIDLSPPNLTPGGVPCAEEPSDLTVAFRSRIETVGEEIGFQHYLFPEQNTVGRLLAGADDGRIIESEKLAGFDRIARNGATKISENLERMTGIDTETAVWREFISLDAIPGSLSNERLISVAFTFDGLPSGYLVFLFDRDSAVSLVEALLGTEPSGELGALERDAVCELSNVMTSGLIDGWANTLDTTIDHSTPAYTHDMGASVVDPLVVGLSERQEFAFVFDVCIRGVDTPFQLDVFAIPDENDLIYALERLETERVEESTTTPQFASVDTIPHPSSFAVEKLTEPYHP